MPWWEPANADALDGYADCDRSEDVGGLHANLYSMTGLGSANGVHAPASPFLHGDSRPKAYPLPLFEAYHTTCKTVQCLQGRPSKIATFIVGRPGSAAHRRY